MLLTINQEQYPDYLQKFKDAVRLLFPILCFTPDETAAFSKAMVKVVCDPPAQSSGTALSSGPTSGGA